MSKKRLTVYGDQGYYVTDDECFDVWAVPKRFMGVAIEKLAAYEDLCPTPQHMEDALDDAYDTGYQSCLNRKGMSWDEAEELQRYRELGPIVELSKRPDVEAKPEKTLWIAKLNNKALIIQAGTSAMARELAKQAFGTFGAQVSPLWKGRTHISGVFKI